MSQEKAILRLARQIDAAKKDERFLVNANEVVTLRREGASLLHGICAEFVASLNSGLADARVELSPATYRQELFRESGANVIQISSQGRQMQIVFEVPSQLVSTEKFGIPYILEGEVRTFNQRMLERFEIRSQLIFFCVEKETGAWRFLDWRTRHTGPVDFELLVSLMEPLF